MAKQQSAVYTRAYEQRQKARKRREIRVWVPDRDQVGPGPEQQVRELARQLCEQST